MKKIAIIIIAGLIPAMFFSCSGGNERDETEPLRFDENLIIEAENLIGLSFDTAEHRMMGRNLTNALRSYEAMRAHHIDNSIAPALYFTPLAGSEQERIRDNNTEWLLPDDITRPENDDDLAFMKVSELACLVRTGQITSMELTQLYLSRLREYSDSLHCVVTLTENLALEQAGKADREIAAGNYRGPLHGIPYGVKDLLAVEGYRTTWGAKPYEDQVINTTATVVTKLEEAGAVLVAKLSMGALAMGDLWFGGRTRNPWNLKQGSSGSSAGSASATAAGLVGFSIGTETLGSIVSPSTRCGVTSLRPTFGRVSRTGAMALSWSMDKIGPICRSAEDCALVFNEIIGSDGIDLTIVDKPFSYNGSTDVKSLKVGYFKSAFDQKYDNKANDAAVLRTFRSMGVNLIPVELEFDDIPVQSLRIILTAEAAAAFDELTRYNLDTLLTGQSGGSWPNTFRAARFIPAVEYIQANRFRTILMQEMENLMKEYDVIITPSYGGNQLLITNLTGHPCVVVPNGFTDEGSPTSISFIGNLYDEATILTVARAYQQATGFDEEKPPLFYGK